jgi:hypothetical protein
MLTVTLLAKVYNNSQLKFAEEFLRSTLRGLDVAISSVRVVPHRWVQITVSGEDEKVALHYLADEIGLCPASLEEIKRFSAVRGRITAMNENSDKLFVDIGAYMPESINVTIPVQRLQAQLLDGRKVALKKIAELYGFCENLPLGIKISDVDMEHKLIEAVISEEQLTLYGKWTKSLLDRLIILGASSVEIGSALRIERCNRDVINMEPLGLFEYAVVCKLGTDARGLIPKIGRSLRNASFTVFDPKKVLDFLEYSAGVIS